jgi:hypothetical protein
MAGGFIRTLATVAAKRRSTSVMRRRVRCGAALGSRTMWPVIGGGGSAMSYGGRSAGSGSNGPMAVQIGGTIMVATRRWATA